MNTTQTQLEQKSRDSYITFSQLSYLSIAQFDNMHICLPVGTVRVDGNPFWKEHQSIAGSDNKSRKLS